jgi:predicted regulator of Ras-like GTPase activity (Roadblock/LC7/MglB family)
LAWTTALELDAGHAGANKGIGFLYYKVGDHAQTLRHLEAAQAIRPGDPGVEAALRRVRDRLAAPEQPAPPPPAPPASAAPATPASSALPFAFEEEPASADTPQGAAASEATDAQVFAGLEGAESGLLLLDAKGMRLGGGLLSPAGGDVADAVAADLAGVSRDAARAAKLLGLGAWRTLAAESPDGSMLLVAPTPETILLAVRDPSVPVGRLAYSVERAAAAARRWLEGLG